MKVGDRVRHADHDTGVVVSIQHQGVRVRYDFAVGTYLEAPQDLTVIGPDPKLLADQIRESAECVLRVALAREGITATAEQIASLAREIGANAAQSICAQETT